MMSTPHRAPIRLCLVETYAIVRAGLRLLLSNRPDMVVVGEAANSQEALAVAADVCPDMVILGLDGESALDLLPRLCPAVPQAHVLILTSSSDATLLQRAILLGARGLVHKEKPVEVLFQAIVKVHAGEAWLDRTMMASVIDALGHASRHPHRDPEAAKIMELTARERDVIALLGEGLRNRQIATRLHLSETTVRHHLTVIFDKLQVVDRLELAVYAYRHGLAPLP